MLLSPKDGERQAIGGCPDVLLALAYESVMTTEDASVSHEQQETMKSITSGKSRERNCLIYLRFLRQYLPPIYRIFGSHMWPILARYASRKIHEMAQTFQPVVCFFERGGHFNSYVLDILICQNAEKQHVCLRRWGCS